MDETAQNFEASTDAIIMLIGIFGMPSPSLGRLHMAGKGGYASTAWHGTVGDFVIKLFQFIKKR